MDVQEQRARLEKAQVECGQRMLDSLMLGGGGGGGGGGGAPAGAHYNNIFTWSSLVDSDNATVASAATRTDFTLHIANLTKPEPSDGGRRNCGIAWDNLLCWDEAPPGSLQKQACPDYIHGFDTNEFATRYCTENGTWFFHPVLKKHWTNFSACHSTVEMTADMEHADRLNLIRTIGYGVSLCSLVIAVLIMCCSRRLKSKSNTLHMNLFLAFILRACLAFMIRLLFVRELGLKKDLRETADGTLTFIEEGIHWECRLLQTLFMYAICVSQMWIFVEGLYLHMLIYRTLSTERNGVRIYIMLGWLLPFAIVVPWIVVKAVFDNKFCWNYSTKPGYIWIIHGPMFTTVLLNFVFFLNISRVLCSRVRSSQRHMGRAKYRRLAKFILVLIPLFGVFYIALTLAMPMGYANRFNLVHMYVEMTYNSFQGFILALLFCFLNEEVHSEIKRIWWRRRTRRRDSVATRSFVLSSFKRGSYHNNRTAINNVNHQHTTPNQQQPLNSSAHLSRSDSADVKQEAWSGRLKKNVLRLLRRGRSSERERGGTIRNSTSPFNLKDDCRMELSRIENNDDIDAPMRLEDSERNEDPTSSG